MQSIPGSSSFERWLLRKILRAIGDAPVCLVLGDGVGISPPGSSPVATITIRNRSALPGLVLNPEVGFGDAYMNGHIELHGNLVEFLETVYRSWSYTGGGLSFRKLIPRWIARFAANTPRRSRSNVHHHYDLNTEFYQRWLDRQLVYTCGYFPTPSATLEEAQIAKMEHVCRKLELQPGETVVEAGCGWGALALHMARNYGVRVKAFNLSHEQIVYARQSARQQGLSGEVEFIEDDYRNIRGRFDVFASVGMLEHVGTSHYPDLGRVIHGSIGSAGRGLLHFIGRNSPAPLSAWITKRIFPGGYAPALGEVAEIFEPWNFSICDVENLRLHYAKTLEHWLARFEGSAQQISSMFDARFVRAWRLYLAGSLAAFRTGTLQLFQLVFAGPDCRRIPWTRAHLYQEPLGQREPKWIHSMS